ncbi:hypothetical protein hrd7_05720 [Leptolinea sp. HRD-7]|nr:hypothetical protein hrd7_05720 [Leptolinea sp. HRD-7]
MYLSGRNLESLPNNSVSHPSLDEKGRYINSKGLPAGGRRGARADNKQSDGDDKQDDTDINRTDKF